MYVCMYVLRVWSVSRSQSSPPNLSPLLRISSDDDRFVSSWMQRQQQRRSQKALPPGQINMSYIVDMRLASADQQDIGDGDDDDDDDTGNMDEDDPRDRSWNSIGQQKKHFICPSTVPEGDELDGESMVHTYMHTYIHNVRVCRIVQVSY